MHVSRHSFYIPCQGKSNFLPCQQHFSSVPKSFHNHSVYQRDTTEAVKAVINFLTKVAVDSHLLSNIPAVYIGMIQIPFTIDCYIKRKQNQ